MSNVWHGSDPTAVADAADYELGTVLVALQDITLSGIRVFSPSTAKTLTARKGHVWTMDGTLAATITMPAALTTGWSTHLLGSALSLSAGDARMISYETGGNYADVPHGLDSPVVAANKAAMFPDTSTVDGNGRFNTTPGSFPDSTFNATFYGVDAVFDVVSTGGAGDTLPEGSTLLEEIAVLLDAKDVGTYHPDGSAGGTIYLTRMPDTPDSCLAVARYPGPESDSKLPYDQVSVQVRCRGPATDARISEKRAQATYDALHGLGNVTLAAGSRLQLAVGTQSGPAYIDVDELGRHQWTVNFRLQVMRPTANRPAPRP